MQHAERGAAALTVIGAILLVVGGLAIAMAPQIMNSAEMDAVSKDLSAYCPNLA